MSDVLRFRSAHSFTTKCRIDQMVSNSISWQPQDRMCFLVTSQIEAYIPPQTFFDIAFQENVACGHVGHTIKDAFYYIDAKHGE